MKVKELIALLADCDPETLVVLASDGEGNEYSPLAGASDARYVPESTWSGYLVDDDEDEEDVPDAAVPALVIWPTN